MPIRKYHLRFLWWKVNIPIKTPILPIAAAIKKSMPSEMRGAPTLRDFTLSENMMKKAMRLMRKNARPT